MMQGFALWRLEVALEGQSQCVRFWNDGVWIMRVSLFWSKPNYNAGLRAHRSSHAAVQETEQCLSFDMTVWITGCSH